jgi:hypothetical protein
VRSRYVWGVIVAASEFIESDSEAIRRIPRPSCDDLGEPERDSTAPYEEERDVKREDGEDCAVS